jgi:D-sedoheptulose 7-phosphate isomerase
MNEIIINSLNDAQQVLSKCLNNQEILESIDKAASIIANSLSEGNKIISCGNGGSLCDATHFAEELTGRFHNNRRPLPAIAINDPGYLTCVANDYGFEYVFSRYVEAFGQKGDVLLAISTSGSSKNIVNAAREARKKSMNIVSLTGEGNNELSELSDVSINVPYKGYADRIQEIHIKVIHIIIQIIESKLNLI